MTPQVLLKEEPQNLQLLL